MPQPELNRIYTQFLERKALKDIPTGLENPPDLNGFLFDFQRDIVRWALHRGRAAIFADCGTGKTPMQLEWAKHVPGKVIILAPLAVAQQTVREGDKFSIPVTYSRKQSGSLGKITITNYEMLDRFDCSSFDAVVLDESSILKSYDGKTRTDIINAFQQTPFRLACTATPAPNDLMEIANHSEFVGAMTRQEMLSMFFVHDGGETQRWRLKGHAETDFWCWLCSWAVMMRKPSDFGYSDGKFVLPELKIHDETIRAVRGSNGYLFPMPASDLRERISSRRNSIQERTEKVAEIVNASKEPWVVWCNLNSESSMAVGLIPDAVEIRGDMSLEDKESAVLGFSTGKHRVVITKSTITGFGLNWQHCNNVVFLGLSDSWEAYYQAIRRCWRFGQQKPVHVWIVTADTEGPIVANIKRKEADAEVMVNSMLKNMKDINTKEIHGQTVRRKDEFKVSVEKGKHWEMRLGDCVDEVGRIQSDSIHYTIYSPPFASLYTYSASERDMGNCKDHAQFFEHYRFLVKELYKITMPGRLMSFHCMNLPTSKVRDGIIGIKDFRGELIRAHEAAGWVYHSEVVIWKDPVTAMQRTKALGLLHKQLKKDSCMSRQGIADYLVTMRKPGENQERVSHTNDSFPVEVWQNYASPVWMDINPNDTLQYRSAREHKDERHICPLQLEVIRRAIRLWTNPRDLVLSPFAGIGSEGFVAIQMGRRFLGIELKESYYRQACANLESAVKNSKDLFPEV